MNAIVYTVDVYLNTIHIPHRLQLTSAEKRDRFVIPDGDKLSEGDISYWVVILSIIPAVLTVILLFIESEVTLLDCFKVSKTETLFTLIKTYSTNPSVFTSKLCSKSYQRIFVT